MTKGAAALGLAVRGYSGDARRAELTGTVTALELDSCKSFDLVPDGTEEETEPTSSALSTPPRCPPIRRDSDPRSPAHPTHRCRLLQKSVKAGRYVQSILNIVSMHLPTRVL